MAVEAFDLVEAPMAIGSGSRRPSPRHLPLARPTAEIVVIDKENGGKADALNAGINAARYPLVCVIDADSLLEHDALMRVVLPFLEDPTTVAAGGIIRIVNGCKVEAGRSPRCGLPEQLARDVPGGRIPARVPGRPRRLQSAMGALLIISGAFGIFRRRT